MNKPLIIFTHNSTDLGSKYPGIWICLIPLRSEYIVKISTHINTKEAFVEKRGFITNSMKLCILKDQFHLFSTY